MEERAHHRTAHLEQRRGHALHHELLAVAEEEREQRRDHLGRYRRDIGEMQWRYRGDAEKMCSLPAWGGATQMCAYSKPRAHAWRR